MILVEIYGIKLPETQLTTEELDIFHRQIRQLVGTVDSVERRIILDNIETIIAGIQAIKHKLNNPYFAGLNPHDAEIGMSLIRPGHVKSEDKPRTNWSIKLNEGYQDWLFGAPGQPFIVGDDHGIIALYIKSFAVEPKISEMIIKFGRIELIPIDVRSIVFGDNENHVKITPIPPILVMPKEGLHIRISADKAGNDELALGGITAGLGRYLRKESY
jgi:hypothetical protein